MPLRVRAQVELRLLDQEHEALQVRGDETLHAHHELEAAVGGGPVLLGERRPQELRDLGGPGARGRRDHRARAQVRRQEEHRRRAGPVEVERVGRPRVEEDRAAVELRLQVDPPRRAARDVVDRRRRRGRLEQRPDRGQHGRLAARRLADERADRAGLEVELAGGTVAVDRDALQRRHGWFSYGAQSEPRYTAGSPGCQRRRKRWMGGWMTISASSVRSNRRCPRTAASWEVTVSSERPERSPAKTMCTTCLPVSARAGEIESTIATGPSTGSLSSMPTSSES